MPSPQASPANGHDTPPRFLIAAGTARYDHLPEERQLPSVAGDLRLIVDCFARLGYQRVLAEVSENPTTTQFERAVCDWFTDPARTSRDQVVFYYSGHGETRDRHYLWLADTQARLEPRTGALVLVTGTAVASEDLIRPLILDSPIQQAIILLDTCHSGRGINELIQRVAALDEHVRWDDALPHGLSFVAASRSREFATEGAFARAFTSAVLNPISKEGGLTQPYLHPDDVMESVKRTLEANYPHQHAVHHPWNRSRDVEMLPNLQYQPDVPLGLDLESQRQRDLIEHWVPRARGAELGSFAWYFTGRVRALRELVDWLTSPSSGGRAHVVIGGPGTGKSAILARLITLADPECRQQMEAANALPQGSAHPLPPVGSINVAIHARGRTVRDVLQRIAQAASVEADGPAALIEAVARSRRRLIVLVDALDEAADPKALARDVLRPLTGFDHIWLLVGTRPDTQPGIPGRRLRALGSATVEIDLDCPEYLGPDDVATYVERRLLAEQEPERRTPYRNQPELARAVAQAVARRAGNVFLVARIVSRTLVEADHAVDMSDRGWQERFPADVGQAFDEFLDRFDSRPVAGLTKAKVIDILTPLAYAEGVGLPWQYLWAPLASALAGRSYADSDIRLVLEHAGAYVIEARAHERSVYRLYHEALSEYVREQLQGMGYAEVQRRIAETLRQTTANRIDGGGKDWLRAHPYVRTYLASHAAAAGLLDELVLDPFFLVAADREQLLRSIPKVESDEAREARWAYEAVAQHVSTVSPGELVSYLELVCRQNELSGLDDGIAGVPIPRPWTVPWARWRVDSPHRMLGNHQAGHRGWVNSVAVGVLDGRPVVVSAGSANEVWVWDFTGGTPAYRLPLLPGGPEVVEDEVVIESISEDINQVAVGEVGDRPIMILLPDGTSPMQMYDLGNGMPLKLPLIGHGHNIFCMSLVALDDCSLLVVAHHRGIVNVWNLEDGTHLHELRTGHKATIRAVALCKLEGRLVVVLGATDGTVRVWDLINSKLLYPPLKGHSRRRTSRHTFGQMSMSLSEGGVHGLAVGKLDGHAVVVSCGGEGTIRAWNLANGAPLYSPLTGHRGEILDVALGTVAKRPTIVSGGQDGTVRVWSLADGAPMTPPLLGHEGPVQSATIDVVDGRAIIVSSGQDETVRAWDLEFCMSIRSARTSSAEIGHCLAADRAGGKPILASGGSDGRLWVWDARNGALVRQPMAAHQGAVTAVAVGELNGQPIAVSGGEDQVVRVWDLARGTLMYPPLVGHTQEISALALGEVDHRPVIISGGQWDCTVRVWDLGTGEALYPPLTGHDFWISSVTVGNLNGQQVLVSAEGIDGTIRVWDLASGTFIRAIPAARYHGGVEAVTTGTLDGHPIVVSCGDWDHVIQVWHLTDGRPIYGPLRGHTGWIKAVIVVELDGQPLILSGSEDKTVRLWNLADGSLFRTINVGSALTAAAHVESADIALAAQKGLMLVRLGPIS
jgi:WD40 repeat protein